MVFEIKATAIPLALDNGELTMAMHTMMQKV